MKTRQYNQGIPTAQTQGGSLRGDLVADCTKKSALGQAPTVSVSSQSTEPTNRHGQGRQPRDTFRQEFGQFIATECGVRFVREESVYDPKSAEKIVPERTAVTGELIEGCRDELHRGKVPGSCLEGFYHWLAVYGGLSEQEKAEQSAGRDREGGEW